MTAINQQPLAGYELGKAEAKWDQRTRELVDYIAGLPAAPPSIDRSTGANGMPLQLQMFVNNSIGDCTEAARGNMELLWGNRVGRLESITDTQVIKAYSAVSGYDPSTGANDNGAYEIDVLNQWRRTKLGTARRLVAYAAVNLHYTQHVQLACYHFDGVYVGGQLPIALQSQLQNNQVWDIDPNGGSDYNPGSWGGHAFILVDYNAQGPRFGSWGTLYQATWRWWTAYVDEAYALVSQDMLEQKDQRTELGESINQLLSDVKAVK